MVSGSLIATPIDFSAEQVAIKLGLLALAETNLTPHVLDAPPAGFTCRRLLAQVLCYKGDFLSMHHQLRLTPPDASHAFLTSWYEWDTHKRVYLLPLLFAHQSSLLGQFLSDYNAVVLEPVGSPKWAQFWTRHQWQHLPSSWERLALQIKETITQGKGKNLSVALSNLNQTIRDLFRSGRYEDLYQVLIQNYAKLEGTQWIYWMLQIKQAIQAPVDDAILTYLNRASVPQQSIHPVLKYWLRQTPNNQRSQLLYQLYWVYKNKNAAIHAQYLKLLQVQSLIQIKSVTLAQQAMDKLKNVDPSLQWMADSIAAQIALSETPPNYSTAAYLFEHASQKAPDKHQRYECELLAFRCYNLAGNYERGYALYHNYFWHAAQFNNFPPESFIKEGCFCGILGHQSAASLEKDLQGYEAKLLLSSATLRSIRFAWIRHNFEAGNTTEVLEYLQQPVFHMPFYRTDATLYRSKCLLKAGLAQQADTVLNALKPNELAPIHQADYYLLKGYISQAANHNAAAHQALQSFFNITGALPIDLRAQATLLQAQLYANDHNPLKAKQILLDFLPQTNLEWYPFIAFQAGCYSERIKPINCDEVLGIFKELYLRQPNHPLAKDGQIKSGLVLLQQNRPQIAQIILEDLLPHVNGEQALWVRYLIQKCKIIGNNQPLDLSQAKLEALLDNPMSLALQLEIELQLAFVQQAMGDLPAMQSTLLQACRPLFEDNAREFTSVELYWFKRCLFTLYRYTTDPQMAQQIYGFLQELGFVEVPQLTNDHE